MKQGLGRTEALRAERLEQGSLEATKQFVRKTLAGFYRRMSFLPIETDATRVHCSCQQFQEENNAQVGNRCFAR